MEVIRRATYKGMDSEYRFRIAEIAYGEEERPTVERIFDLLKIKGWQVDDVTDGYALVPVEDMDEFKGFMEDWKACKRCIRNCIRYGF